MGPFWTDLEPSAVAFVTPERVVFRAGKYLVDVKEDQKSPVELPDALYAVGFGAGYHGEDRLHDVVRKPQHSETASTFRPTVLASTLTTIMRVSFILSSVEKRLLS